MDFVKKHAVPITLGVLSVASLVYNYDYSALYIDETSRNKRSELFLLKSNPSNKGMEIAKLLTLNLLSSLIEYPDLRTLKSKLVKLSTPMFSPELCRLKRKKILIYKLDFREVKICKLP